MSAPAIPVETDGDLRRMFDANYITPIDLDGDVTVTIVRIVGAVVEGEKGRKARKPIIYLKGWGRPLPCNKTNMKTLHSLYGTFKAEALVGKRITLYATECKAVDGGKTMGVRIRPMIPTSPGAPQPGTGGGA
jgi:hypothetical protein